MSSVKTGELAALVLAAGQSRRMGQAKMLLPWGQTTVLGQVVQTLSAATRDTGMEITVITGGSQNLVKVEVARLAQQYRVRALFNTQYETGEMMSSIRVGLASLPIEVETVLIALGDQPQLSLEAARKIILARETSVSRLILPSYAMRRGHPWLVRKDLWPALLASATARDFLKAHTDEIFYVETDASVLQDLDTPEDYRRGLKDNP